ncbi:MAG: putative oxidoreductase [Ilumatobacteraceae bacterium]|nr:putative oxidoreductase [Ilumatobacteraceae bacterium]
MTREFSPEPVDPVLIDELLDIARRAPSAGFSQGVHFVVLSGEQVERFWSVTAADEWFSGRRSGVMQASIIVLPFAVAREYTARYSEPDKIAFGLDDAANWPVPFWLTDTAMATQNLLLLLEDRGLGALYFGVFEGCDVFFRELGVPDDAQTIGVIAIGHRAATDRPSGSPRARGRRPLGELVHRNRW